ncbi:LOW QUALITY PROTEIN: hypothetical protein HID58_048147, partial [Brassica napus]
KTFKNKIMAYSVQKEVYSSDKTLSNVVLQNLKFPDSPLGSLQAKDFIRELLVKRRQRTGSSQRKVLQRLNDNNSLKGSGSSGGNYNRYLECKTIGSHLEFKLF